MQFLPSKEKKVDKTAEKKIPIFPSFDEIDHLSGSFTDSGDLYLSVKDLMKAMQYNVSLTTMEKKMKDLEAQSDLKTSSMVCNISWSKSKKWVFIAYLGSPELCLHSKDLKPFALWFVKRMRKSKVEKNRICRLIGVEVNDTEVEVPIENKLLYQLEQACPFEMQTQYRIDRYRLDAYFPRLRLAIEIDEHGHQRYDTKDEKEKETTLRDHNIVLIRFNPHGSDGSEKKDAPLQLIQQVWLKTVSPDFTAFRTVNQLT